MPFCSSAAYIFAASFLSIEAHVYHFPLCLWKNDSVNERGGNSASEKTEISDERLRVLSTESRVSFMEAFVVLFTVIVESK